VTDNPLCLHCGRTKSVVWEPDSVTLDGKCYREIARDAKGRSGKRRRATLDCLRLPTVDWCFLARERQDRLDTVERILSREHPPMWSEVTWYANLRKEALDAVRVDRG